MFHVRIIFGTRKVINITNPAGVSVTTFIKNRLEGSELWEDLTINNDLSQYPDFYDRQSIQRKPNFILKTTLIKV